MQFWTVQDIDDCTCLCCGVHTYSTISSRHRKPCSLSSKVHPTRCSSSLPVLLVHPYLTCPAVPATFFWLATTAGRSATDETGETGLDFAICELRPATCNLQPVTCDLRLATCDWHLRLQRRGIRRESATAGSLFSVSCSLLCSGLACPALLCLIEPLPLPVPVCVSIQSLSCCACQSRASQVQFQSISRRLPRFTAAHFFTPQPLQSTKK